MKPMKRDHPSKHDGSKRMETCPSDERERPMPMMPKKSMPMKKRH